MLIPGKLYKNTRPDNYWVFKNDIFLYLGTEKFMGKTVMRFAREKEEITFSLSNVDDFVELMC